MRLAAAVTLLAVARAAAAAPAVLTGVEVHGPSIVHLELSAPVEPIARRLPADGALPSRVYLDLPGTALGSGAILIPGTDDLLRVRAGQFDPSTVRVVLDLRHPLPFAVRRSGNTVTVEIAPARAALDEPPPAAPPPDAVAAPDTATAAPPAPPAADASPPVPAEPVGADPSATAPPEPPPATASAAPTGAEGDPAPPAPIRVPPPATEVPIPEILGEGTDGAVLPPPPAAGEAELPVPPVAEAALLSPTVDPPEPAPPPLAEVPEVSPTIELPPPPPPPAAAEPTPPVVADAPPPPAVVDPPPAAPAPLPPAALPVVVLDAGHGGRDPGAEGVGGVIEKDVVLELALLLAERLPTRLAVAVVMTRSDDSFVSIERRLSVPPEGAALFLSLHANACNDPSARGLEIFYGGGSVRHASTGGTSGAAALLGQCIDEALRGRVGPVRGAPRPGSFRVLTQNPVPSALVEIGYLTHPAEAERARDASYHALLADALIEAVASFLRASATPPL